MRKDYIFLFFNIEIFIYNGLPLEKTLSQNNKTVFFFKQLFPTTFKMVFSQKIKLKKKSTF